MISKELLSEVMGEKRVVLDYEVSVSREEIHYGHKDINEDGFINIYELANKCKEWANKKSYTVIDYIDINNDEFWTCRAYPNGLNDGFDYEAIYQPLSPISIFDVCQWILDNKKEGN